MSFVNDPFVVAQMAKAQQLVNEQLRAKYNPAPIQPNAGIPTQYTQQAPQSGGLMGGDSLAPMRAFQKMYGSQGSPAQMQQNRQNYLGQYGGSAESLAPMQMLNQYRGTQAAPGAAPTAGGK